MIAERDEQIAVRGLHHAAAGVEAVVGRALLAEDDVDIGQRGSCRRSARARTAMRAPPSWGSS